MTKVSVIVPVYNVQQYLEQCLNSILNQTLKDIEVICVDDGSTDNSLNILNAYAAKDSRVRVLTQNNSYAGAARNKGMDEATGKYLVFLDADDFFEKDMLQSMYDKCEEDSAEICLCNGRIFDESDHSFKEFGALLNMKYIPEETPFSSADISERLFNVVSPAPWTKMFKREFVVSNNIRFQHIKKTNDLFFVYTSLACSKSITYVDKVFANYRTGNSASLQGATKKPSLDFYTALHGLKNELIARGIFTKFEKSFVNRALRTCLYCLERADSKESYITIAENLKNSYLHRLNILGHSRGYFYIKKDFEFLIKLLTEASESLWMEKENEKNTMDNFAPLIDINEWKSPISLPVGTGIKVSVIIPVYNMEEYLDDCIQSVLKNTLKDIEIICVNDGSTDSSPEILKNYADKDSRIIIVDKENGGLSSSRNAGMKVASGEYILFLDSDDYIDCRALEYLYCESKADNLDQLFFSAVSFFKNENLESRFDAYSDYYTRKYDYSGIMTGRKLFCKMSEHAEFKPSACLQLIRREFLEQSGIYFLEGVVFEDNLFTIQCLAFSQKVRYANICLYFRRVRDDSIVTSASGLKYSYSYYRILKEIKKFINEESLYKDREYCYYLFIQLQRICYNASDLASASDEEEFQAFLNSLEPNERFDFYFYIKSPIASRTRSKELSKEVRLFKEKCIVDEYKRRADLLDMKNCLERAEKKTERLENSVEYIFGKKIVSFGRRVKRILRKIFRLK